MVAVAIKQALLGGCFLTVSCALAQQATPAGPAANAQPATVTATLPTPATAVAPAITPPAAPAATTALPPASPKPPAATSLLEVKRIYIDSFGDDAVSRQIQAMVVSPLTDSKRFIVTENKEKADAFLRGAALEKTSQEFHAYNSETSGGSAAGSHSGSVDGSWNNYGGSVHGSSSGGFSSVHAAIADSNASTETINDARIAVRLVNQDGDVIWASTKESKGAKYKGASADVADQVVKQLLHDTEKLEKKPDEMAAPSANAAIPSKPASK